MTDFYNLLNIEKTASNDEIQAAIKKARRLWNNRSTNPNADIRAQAEQNIRDIAQAEKILLDAGERAKYDAELSSAPIEQMPVQNNYTGDDWVKQADELKARNNYYSIVVLAQNVVSAQPNNWLAWYVLGDAHYHQGNLSDAEQCIQQSLHINPSSVAYESLGFLYWDAGNLVPSAECFEKAANLTPSDPAFKYEYSLVLLELGKVDQAYNIIEEGYKNDSSNKLWRSSYFDCIKTKMYNAVSYNKSSGRHLITNERQLEFVKEYLPKLATISSPTEGKEQNVVSEFRQMVSEAEAKRYDDHFGPAFVWIIAAVVALIFFHAVGILFVIGIGVVFYFTHFKTGLEWNKLNISNDIKRTGMQ